MISPVTQLTQYNELYSVVICKIQRHSIKVGKKVTLIRFWASKLSLRNLKKKKGNEKGNSKCVHLISQVNYIYPCDFGETVSAQNWLPL